MEKNRCPWPANHTLAIAYHDNEWGTPLHNDDKHFEFIVLDSFQAGLSWNTILNKRENFRKAFDNFDYRTIALYDEAKVLSLMQDAGIIRNQAKIRATVGNAIAFMKIQEEFGSFDRYIWQFTGGKTLDHGLTMTGQTPVSTPESDAMSKDLIKRGFKFAGTTICYAYMQAAGMVNDHLTSCFRHGECMVQHSTAQSSSK
jgi:DNA-3-methyladenine glycosylase I